MPYIPPNSNQVQPIAIPIGRTHQLAIDNIPSDPPIQAQPSSLASSSSSSNTQQQVTSPEPIMSNMEAGELVSLNSNSEPIEISPSKESSIDTLSSGIAATSLYSNASTPPLDREDSSNRSQHLTSPATSSVISLPEQGEGDGQGVKTSRSDSSLRRRVNEANEEMDHGEEEEGKKVAGEQVINTNTDSNINTDLLSDHEDAKNAFALYREGLYAYTHTLWIQAKLSSSRAERRRQSVSTQGQFGNKQSGMERMAAKKALAKRLNG